MPDISCALSDIILAKTLGSKYLFANEETEAQISCPVLVTVVITREAAYSFLFHGSSLQLFLVCFPSLHYKLLKVRTVCSLLAHSGVLAHRFVERTSE